MKVHFINKTNDTIYTNLHDYTSHLNCSFPYVLPLETKSYSFKQEFYGTRKSDIPKIESINYINVSCSFFYSKTHNCEKGIRDIKKYENRKEVNPLVFEFTFRFTEEKRKNSEPCNL